MRTKEDLARELTTLVVQAIREEFIKTANGAEAMKFEEAVHKVAPYATDWIDPKDEALPQG